MTDSGLVAGRSIDDSVGMRIASAIASSVIIAGVAQAQPSRPSEPSSPRLPGQPFEEVQQGVEDLGPLGESFEVPMSDLRVPTGFDRVYRAPGGGLMRINGAIHAVFPRSEYVATPRGVTPIVPAGAVFYLGEPRAWSLDASGEPTPARATGSGAASPLRVDNRLTARVAPARAGGRDERSRPASDRATVMTDESYRRKRLASILDEALQRSAAPEEAGADSEAEAEAAALPAQGG